MTKKPSLYEILDVPLTANSAEIDQAWRAKLGALERAVGVIDVKELASRKQLIRVAANTLLDSSSRLAYDAHLARSENPDGTSNNQGTELSRQVAVQAALGLALVPQVPPAISVDSMNLRADALALRAEAMSLRADALILQAGVRLADSGQSAQSRGWSHLMGSGPILRILVFLTVMGLIALGWARCSSAVAPLQRMATDGKASEKAVLQEYFQTHGVRPANLAEMELLEAERRRRNNDNRNEQQNADQKAKAELRFEEDARKRAEEVSERLRNDEERQKMAAQREERDAERQRNERKESERMAEERRVQKLQEQWQQTLRR
jgi:curved DNA-binding protein CbpA